MDTLKMDSFLILLGCLATDPGMAIAVHHLFLLPKYNLTAGCEYSTSCDPAFTPPHRTTN